MNISVDVGSRRFGGYETDAFTIQIRYVSKSVDRNDVLDGDYDVLEVWTPDAAADRKKVTHLLLGKRTPKSISLYGETILHRGERISRLHLDRFFEDWAALEWDRFPWRDALARIAIESFQREIKRALRTEEAGIRVRFGDGGEAYPRTGGQFVVTMPVARYLARCLLDACNGEMRLRGSSAKVKNDSEIRVAKPK